MRVLARIAIIAVTSSIATVAAAGPFGLEKGMTLQELQKHGALTQSSGTNTYKASKIKNGHDAFEFYEFIISPTVGLCKIAAAGKDIQSNSFGDQIKDSFKSLEEPLIRKYGTPSNQHDFLQGGSIWKDRNDWMMALYKEERTLSTFWTGKSLPDSLEAIMLQASALSNSKGWVALHYEFNNITACLQENKQKRNSNL